MQENAGSARGQPVKETFRHGILERMKQRATDLRKFWARIFSARRRLDLVSQSSALQDLTPVLSKISVSDLYRLLPPFVTYNVVPSGESAKLFGPLPR